MIHHSLVKVACLAVAVPLSVFVANWVHRSEKGYPQTAAADFLLGVLIFDGTVILATNDFRPFLQSEELREMIGYWHFGFAFASGLVWLAIVHWAEPQFAIYYTSSPKMMPRQRFPVGTFIICWLSVLILVAINIGYFAL